MYDFDGSFMILQAIKASVIHQLAKGKELLAESDENSEALALIIDGKSLTYALEDDVKDLFLELAVGCASVICCRSSPKQKALVSFSCTLQSLQLLFIYLLEKKQQILFFFVLKFIIGQCGKETFTLT